jgi:hypothetical protein
MGLQFGTGNAAYRRERFGDAEVVRRMVDSRRGAVAREGSELFVCEDTAASC